MSLDSGSDDLQIDHDDSASKGHAYSKAMFGERQGEWVLIPNDGEFKFRNDFSAITPEEAPFFICGSIPEVRLEGIEPEDWDASGTMASFSAGSEVAALQDFKRARAAAKLGPDSDGKKLPPPAPPFSTLLRDLNLEKVSWAAYRESLIMARDATQVIKRWGVGAGGRGQWKAAPVSERTVLVEGEALAEILDSSSPSGELVPDLELEKVVEKAKSKEKSKQLIRYDLRRFTVNNHPALARAMAKLLAAGKKEEVMRVVEGSLPKVIRKFEQVTGRRVIGASIHWDSDLPHFNLWHSGLERVAFFKGKGKDRERYRRTATNLGSSGPGLRAWRRTQLAFERLGKTFCPYTTEQLLKEEKKKMELQGRAPGDWKINAAADETVEALLVEGGFEKEVAEGYDEFVANEERRYAAGMAGRLAREEREGLTEEIRKLNELTKSQKADLERLEDQRAQLESSISEIRVAAGTEGRLANENREVLAEEIRNLNELTKNQVANLEQLIDQRAMLESSVSESREAATRAKAHADSEVKRAQEAFQEVKARADHQIMEMTASLNETKEENAQMHTMFQRVLDVPGVKKALKMVPTFFWQTLLPFCQKMKLGLGKHNSPNQELPRHQATEIDNPPIPDMN